MYKILIADDHPLFREAIPMSSPTDSPAAK